MTRGSDTMSAPASAPSPGAASGEELCTPDSQARSHQRSDVGVCEILARLEKPGCLLCAEAREARARYFFWFVNESYGELPTITRLQRARGFCLRHTRHLLALQATSQTSYTAGYILQACADWLDAVPSGGSASAKGGLLALDWLPPSAPCPACLDDQETVGRYAWFLSNAFRWPEVVACYSHSDGVCFRHFSEAAPLADWATLQALVRHQRERLMAARQAIQGAGNGTQPAAAQDAWRRLFGHDMEAPIRSCLVAGERGRPPSERSSRPPATASRAWAPAFEETCRLLEQPGCHLCRIAAGARERYLAWFEQEFRDVPQLDYRWNQSRDFCPEHAWLFAARCSAPVFAALGDALLGTALARLEELERLLERPIPARVLDRMRMLPARWQEYREPERGEPGGPVQRVLRTVRSLWTTPRDVLVHLRNRTLRHGRCPVCEHAEQATSRAADRLLAVIVDPEGCRCFGRSYGTCLPHGALLLARAHISQVRTAVRDILLARVSVEHWEVEEWLRKQSWSVRHEARGTEGTAWQRAHARIAGAVDEGGYGF